MNQVENKLNAFKGNTGLIQNMNNPNENKIFQDNPDKSSINRRKSLANLNNRDTNFNFGSNVSQLDLEQPLSEIFFWKLKDYTKDKFDTSLFAKTSLEQILDITIKLAEDLYIIKDKLVQIFPPKYNIFDRYYIEYQDNIFNALYPFVKDENEKNLEDNKGDLILLAKWLDKYETILRKVGIDINACEIGGVIFIFYYFRLLLIGFLFYMINYKKNYLRI